MVIVWIGSEFGTGGGEDDMQRRERRMSGDKGEGTFFSSSYISLFLCTGK